MEYAEWIRAQHGRGIAAEHIAQAALRGPVMSFGNPSSGGALLAQAACVLQVMPEAVHVVGSSRFGFCLRDGTAFDPAYSDLDLAIVDPDLYARCASGPGAVPGQARFPERDLPAPERARVREAFDALSRTVADKYAYVSAAVFPDHAALVGAQAGRIRAYLGVPAEAPATRLPAPSSVSSMEAEFQRIVDAGLPRYSGPVASSTPFNASPWLADRSAFGRAFGGGALRDARLAALDRALGALAQVVDVSCCLVGGSFVDASNTEPGDLDLVVFYRARAMVRFDPGRALQRLTRRFLLEHIDMRCVPCDAEPWLQVKLTSYFTQLYLTRRPGTEDRCHGLVLLLPTPTEQDRNA